MYDKHLVLQEFLICHTLSLTTTCYGTLSRITTNLQDVTYATIKVHTKLYDGKMRRRKINNIALSSKQLPFNDDIMVQRSQQHMVVNAKLNKLSEPDMFLCLLLLITQGQFLTSRKIKGEITQQLQ